MKYPELYNVKVCAGTRFSCPYYTITQQGLQPNKNGNYIDCKPTNFAAILKSMQDGTFTNFCKKEADKYNKKHPDDIRDLKAYAISIYAFKSHRYVVEEKIKDNDNKTKNIRTNDAYNYWTGFKGFDFDPNKAKFNKEQRKEIGLALKEIFYNELNKYHWFIGTGLSTGGHGTHIYTCININGYYDKLSLEEKIRFHDMCYWYMFTKMIHSLEILANTIDYVTLDDAKEMLDTAMLKVGQTLNITPLDNNPFINKDFKFEELKDIYNYFEHTDKDYPVVSDSEYALLSNDEKIRYNIFLDICIGNEKKLIKHFKNIKRTNVIIKECDDFDIHVLDDCKGPWHFEHKRKNGNKFWTGNQIIHTLSFFFSKNTIKNIWAHNKFYDADPKDWIRFVDDSRWDDMSYLPNFKLINWLNKNCNMNLTYEFDDDDKDKTIIKLNEDEYIYDKKDYLFKLLKSGINLIESGTGTGKTTFVKKYYEDIFNNENQFVNVIDYKNTIITEPYNSVIDTKFLKMSENGVVDIIKGSKRIKLIENSSNNICTNYYHINLLKDEDINKVDLLIIDESHLLFSEAYRFKSISEFINKINKFKQVILMTGTPIYERIFFKDCNVIYIDKEDKRTITHEFLRFNPCPEVSFFNITVLSEFVNTLVSNGKKVFIYDKDISIQNCKRFQTINNNLKIAIYHKKHADEPSSTDDMKWIDENHMLGDKFDVIISSCYFSVGNDLYDEGKAAVIMVGMHIPSEIIQVTGRWRNMSEINIYTIIKSTYEDIYDELNFNKLYEYKRKEIVCVKNDYTIRDTSISIFKKYKAVEDKDIDLLTYMETLPVHQRTIGFINNELSKYNVWCDDRIMPLEYNFDYIEQNKEFSKNLKEIRNTFREDFIDKLLKKEEFEWINNDNKLATWQKTVYLMFKHIPLSLFKNNIDFIKCISFIDSMVLFNKFNDRINKNFVDYAEIYSVVKTSERLINKDYMLNDWLSYNYWTCIKGYVLFVCYYNKERISDDMIQGDYFKEFTDMCFNYSSIPISMKEYLFSKNEKQDFSGSWEDVISFDEYSDNIDKVPFEKYVEYFERNKSKKTVKNVEIALFKHLLLKFKNPKSFAGRKGGKKGSTKKKCIITNNMKQLLLKKYNLKVNQTFESRIDLAKYTNTNPKTIFDWISKGYIKNS